MSALESFMRSLGKWEEPRRPAPKVEYKYNKSTVHGHPLTRIEQALAPVMDISKLSLPPTNGQFASTSTPLSPPPLSENVEGMVPPSSASGK